jgi:Ca-activated chloride channel family protein
VKKNCGTVMMPVRSAVMIVPLKTLLMFAMLLVAAAQASPQTAKPQPEPTPRTAPTQTPPQRPKDSPQKKKSQAAEASKAAEEAVGADDVIRVKTTLVNTPVLVIGRGGKYLPTLRREDFQVFEEGVKQDIAYFAPAETPFTVALLIDTSRSTLFDLQDIQDAAISFVDRMRPKDQALVVSFAGQIKVLAELTSDPDVLRRAIRSSRPGGSSRVYDAIDFAITERLDRITGRKALLIFTDGVDNSSTSATYESSLQNLAKSDALIYPIEFSTHAKLKKLTARESPTRRTAPEGSGFSQVDYRRANAYLHQAAAGPGTALHPVSDIKDLGRAVASIADELHNEYSLGYYPRTLPQPGELRRIEVRVKQPQLVVRARTGYLVNESGIAVQPPKSELQTMPSIASELGSVPVPRNSDIDQAVVGARWMCEGSEVTSDFAVVKEGFDSSCPKSTRPNDETNAWFIRKPGPSEIVCKGFIAWDGGEMAGAPIPTGYAVIGELEVPVCARSNDPGVRANAWAIRLPRNGDKVCKGFSIPRGFVAIGERNTRACPEKTPGRNAWMIRSKSRDTGESLIRMPF